MVQLAVLETAPKRSDTRERLLEAAERAVLAKGFFATSIEELIAEVGITKSGFFYHFKDKNELARGLMRRYLDADLELVDLLQGNDRGILHYILGLTSIANDCCGDCGLGCLGDSGDDHRSEPSDVYHVALKQTFPLLL